MSILVGEKLSLPNENNIFDAFISSYNANKDSKTFNRFIIESNGTRVSYVDLLKRVICFVTQFEHRLKPSEPVGLLLENSSKRIAVMLALSKLQIPFVPIDFILPVERIEHILEDAQIQCLLTDNVCEAHKLINCPKFNIDENEDKVNSLSEVLQSNLEYTTENNCGSLDSPIFCIVYSSGSTGQPKGVKINHINLLSHHKTHCVYLPWCSDGVAMVKTSYSFGAYYLEMIPALLNLQTICLATREQVLDVTKFLDIIDKENVTLLYLVPSYIGCLIKLVKSNPPLSAKLSSLKLVIIFGEMVSYKLAKELFAICPADTNLVNMYGSVDMGRMAALLLIKSVDDLERYRHRESVPIGKPLWNCALVVLNEMAQVVPIGQQDLNKDKFIDVEQTKEIKEATNNVFPCKNLLRTGDIGFVSEQTGHLVLVERKDNVIKIRGQYVDTGEINTAVSRILKKSSQVLSVPYHNQAKLVDKIYCFIYCPQSEVTTEEIVEELNKALPQYMIPELIFTDQTFPLLPVSGKIDRVALKNKAKEYANEQEIQNSISLESINRDQLEPLEIVRICSANVLYMPIKNVYLGKSFMNQGGNSLALLELSNCFRKLGFTVGVSDVVRLRDEPLSSMATLIQSDEDNSNMRYTYKWPEHYEKLNTVTALTDLEIKQMREACLQAWLPETNPRTAYLDSEMTALEMRDIASTLVLDKEFENGPYQVIVRDIRNGEIVGACFNNDAKKPYKYSHLSCSRVRLPNELISDLKDPIIAHLFAQKRHPLCTEVLYVDRKLPTSERSVLFLLLCQEREVVARRNGFDCIIGVSVSPATAKAAKLFGWVEEGRIQVNKAETEGIRLFKNAPDDYNWCCHVKYL